MSGNGSGNWTANGQPKAQSPPIQAVVSQGPPYSSRTAILGGVPLPEVDDGVCAAFLFFFALSAAAHMTVLQLNRRAGLTFAFSGMFFALGLLRSVALIMRIIWGAFPDNPQLAIGATVLVQCGTILIFITNLFFAQRLVRGYLPRLGWHPLLKGIFNFLVGCIVLSLVMVIIATIQSVYTLDEYIRRVDRACQLVASTYMAVLAFVPIPAVLLTMAVFHLGHREGPYLNRRATSSMRPLPGDKAAASPPNPPSNDCISDVEPGDRGQNGCAWPPPEKFGIGRWRTKVWLLLTAATLATLGAGFRAGVNFAQRPVNDPAWYHSRACYYIFNYSLDLAISLLYLFCRFDRRFYVPPGCKKPGDYRDNTTVAVLNKLFFSPPRVMGSTEKSIRSSQGSPGGHHGSGLSLSTGFDGEKKRHAHKSLWLMAKSWADNSSGKGKSRAEHGSEIALNSPISAVASNSRDASSEWASDRNGGDTTDVDASMAGWERPGSLSDMVERLSQHSSTRPKQSSKLRYAVGVDSDDEIAENDGKGGRDPRSPQSGPRGQDLGGQGSGVYRGKHPRDNSSIGDGGRGGPAGAAYDGAAYDGAADDEASVPSPRFPRIRTQDSSGDDFLIRDQDPIRLPTLDTGSLVLDLDDWLPEFPIFDTFDFDFESDRQQATVELSSLASRHGSTRSRQHQQQQPRPSDRESLDQDRSQTTRLRPRTESLWTLRPEEAMLKPELVAQSIAEASAAADNTPPAPSIIPRTPKSSDLPPPLYLTPMQPRQSAATVGSASRTSQFSTSLFADEQLQFLHQFYNEQDQRRQQRGSSTSAILSPEWPAASTYSLQTEGSARRKRASTAVNHHQNQPERGREESEEVNKETHGCAPDTINSAGDSRTGNNKLQRRFGLQQVKRQHQTQGYQSDRPENQEQPQQPPPRPLPPLPYPDASTALGSNPALVVPAPHTPDHNDEELQERSSEEQALPEHPEEIGLAWVNEERRRRRATTLAEVDDGRTRTV